MREKEENLVVAKLFEDAISLRDEGKLAEAADKFEEILLLGFKRKAAILGPLAHVYFSMGDLENAERCYSEAVRLSPDSELGSVGYFHTLWKMGRTMDAVNEAKRFLARHESKEYIQLAQEMSDAYRDVLPRSK